MARRGGLTEQLVHDVSWLQHKLRLKEMEAEALLQQCHHLEAERDSLKAAYDLTSAAEWSDRTEWLRFAPSLVLCSDIVSDLETSSNRDASGPALD
ncbi:hypothetical protein CVIRNUC_003407 [Coccomyxa viridis]|uniref:Uncharacterized protein n=1 Tax=Coccomyxa viridis TaxID=1274662 RepID=A0AAV1I0H5_9CHLO|nr:hypothetical protein CVIRNUC_003407 [Coccomyxa viridis]